MRIGPKMAAAVEYVREHPGCSILACGSAIQHYRKLSMSWVYGPVNRAINAGLIRAVHKGNRYELFVV